MGIHAGKIVFKCMTSMTCFFWAMLTQFKIDWLYLVHFRYSFTIGIADWVFGYNKISSVKFPVSVIVNVSFETNELDLANTTVTLWVKATHSACRLIKIPLVGLSKWGYHEQIKSIWGVGCRIGRLYL